MRLAIIGLGRMGMNMARRLLRNGHEVVGYNRSPEKTREIAKEGAVGVYDLAELRNTLSPPRIVWIMVPAGQPVDDALAELAEILESGDIVIDGGNSFYKDAIRREAVLAEKGIRFVDAGVSGGIWGLSIGYCLMVGGDRQVCDFLEPIFRGFAPEDGYLYCGPSGAGHFVKMVHNGIEYGMMQAYAEGLDVLDKSPYRESLDMRKLCHLWNQGSVIRSWLLELAEKAFEQDPGLTHIQGYVEDSGEGRWTVQQAIEAGVSAPIMALSLFARFRSRQEDAFADKVLAALRQQFGGHAVKPE